MGKSLVSCFLTHGVVPPLLSKKSEVTNLKEFVSNMANVWARERCRISPPRFLAGCCKRQLNQVSLV